MTDHATIGIIAGLAGSKVASRDVGLERITKGTKAKTSLRSSRLGGVVEGVATEKTKLERGATSSQSAPAEAPAPNTGAIAESSAGSLGRSVSK